MRGGVGHAALASTVGERTRSRLVLVLVLVLVAVLGLGVLVRVAVGWREGLGRGVRDG